MRKLADAVLTLPHTKPLVERFKTIRPELDALDRVKADLLPAFVDALLPGSNEKLSELRDLALAQLETAGVPEELRGRMMEEFTQSDIPPAVEEVRLIKPS